MKENETKLVLLASSGGKAHRFEMSKAHFTVGRASSADVKLDITGISRAHAEIKIEADQFYVMDCGSLNGTFLNGQKLEPKKWFSFISSDDLRMGLPPLIISVSTLDPVKSDTSLPTEIESLESSLNLSEASVFKKPEKSEVKKIVESTKTSNMTQGWVDSNPSRQTRNPPPPIRHSHELEIKQLQIELDSLKSEVTRNSKLNKQLSDMKDKTQLDLNKLIAEHEKQKSEFEQKQKEFELDLQNKTNEIEKLKLECESFALAREQLSQEISSTELLLKKSQNELAEVTRQKDAEQVLLFSKLELQSNAETQKVEALKVLEEANEKKRILDSEVERLRLTQEDFGRDILKKESLQEELKAAIQSYEIKSLETLQSLKKLQSELEDARVSDRKRKADLEAYEAENRVKLIKLEGQNESLLTQKKSLERDIDLNEKKLVELTRDQEAILTAAKASKEETEKAKALLDLHIRNRQEEAKTIEALKIEKRNLEEQISLLNLDRDAQSKELKKEKENSVRETESIRHEIITRAHEEKERLLKDAEGVVASRETELKEEEIRQKKRLETELTEMRFRASEEIRLMREEEEKRVERVRIREKSALDQGLEQVFRANIQLMKRSDFSESSVGQALKEIQSAARSIMKLDKSLSSDMNLNPELQGYVPFNPNAKKAEKEFWVRLGTRVGSAVAIFSILAFTPFLSFTKTQIKRALSSEQSTTEIFAQRFREAKLNKPKYSPFQDKDYRNTFTDNWLYLEGYDILKTEPEIGKKWVLELDALFKGPLNLGDRIVAEYVPAESSLLGEIAEIRRTMTPENAEAAIVKMRTLEEEKVKKLQEILKGYENYFRVREFEKDFYQKFIDEMK